MNDRFKFRVFISDKKNSKNSLTGMFKVHSLHTGTNKAIISSLYGNVSIKLENNILMQCTGLKDKNGELIYEGDVLQSDEYPFKNEKGYNYAAEVLWDDASATFYYYTFRISDNVVGRSTGNTGELNEYEDWKVIGNKYENPELLKECG